MVTALGIGSRTVPTVDNSQMVRGTNPGEIANRRAKIM
jgi:hypothetical protein